MVVLKTEIDVVDLTPARYNCVRKRKVRVAIPLSPHLQLGGRLLKAVNIRMQAKSLVMKLTLLAWG